MKRFPYVWLVLEAIICSTVGLHAAEGETFTEIAAATGTYERPLLIRTACDTN